MAKAKKPQTIEDLSDLTKGFEPHTEEMLRRACAIGPDDELPVEAIHFVSNFKRFIDRMGGGLIGANDIAACLVACGYPVEKIKKDAEAQ